MKRFEGQVVLITGGSSGIGKATAARFAREGATVVINGRSSEKLLAAVAELAADGEVSGIAADISSEASATQLIDEVIGRYGRLQVLVNSAGIDGAGESVLALQAAGWQHVLDVNLSGPFYTSSAAARHMAAAGGGAIVNVSSLNGLRAEAHFADYNTSKAGLVMLTRSMAIDLVEQNIRVNAVCPGYILTPMTEGYAADPETASAIRSAIPMRRFGDPDEVAGAITFLASGDASYITGEVLVVDGGRAARQ